MSKTAIKNEQHKQHKQTYSNELYKKTGMMKPCTLDPVKFFAFTARQMAVRLVKNQQSYQMTDFKLHVPLLVLRKMLLQYMLCLLAIQLYRYFYNCIGCYHGPHTASVGNEATAVEYK